MADEEHITEEWRVIKEAPDYLVSSLGRVRNSLTGRILVCSQGQLGYRQCTLIAHGKRLGRRTHLLACEAFHGPRPSPKHHTRHLDGDQINNRADNLAWGTCEENGQDRVRHGTQVRGKDHPLAKLTEDDVRYIRNSPQGRKAMASAFGVAHSLIYRIRKRKSWAHVV